MKTDVSDSEIVEEVARLCLELPISLRGPLGSWVRYFEHIAYANVVDYWRSKKRHEESSDSSTRAKYEELRRFLNAVESMNNVLDYVYFENERALVAMFETVNDYRRTMSSNYNQLRALADLANAYKHCVRTTRSGNRMSEVPRASDLQRPSITVSVDLRGEVPRVSTSFQFEGATKEHERILEEAADFWMVAASL